MSSYQQRYHYGLCKTNGLFVHTWGGGNWSDAVTGIDLKTTSYTVPSSGMLIVQYSVGSARERRTNGYVRINGTLVGTLGLGSNDLNGSFYTVATYPVNQGDVCSATTDHASSTVVATFVPAG